MCRYADFMDDVGHIRLQVAFHVFFLALVGIYLLYFCEITVFLYSCVLDSVDNHLIVKWFQNIVICSEVKCIFRDLLLADGCNDDECRMFADFLIFVHPLHDSQPIDFGHDQIQKYDIRLLLFDNIIQIFAISCFSDYIQFFITAHDFIQKL